MEKKEYINPVEERRQRRLKKRKELIQYVLNIIQALSVAATLLHYARMTIEGSWRLYHWFWFVLCVICFVLWFVARVQLGTHLTFQPRADRILVTSGMYKYFKHPIYYFGTMALTSYVFMIEKYSYLLGLLILIPFQVYRAIAEQRVLKRKFEEDYEDYIQTVII